ncbi:hypothetical protein FRX31_009815 [Thalictrum thalictroides]|uniref:Uncharacterized protein n=1 Tax=Thalictrum thalictroides TaxID=46969 RepID=A0A7J6WTA6_THATH|nr:hypothetical protein FRX31_009815 [Thalictrum thalictroides]
MSDDEAMSRSRDRTEDFEDNVRAVALSLNYDEVGSMLATAIFHLSRIEAVNILDTSQQKIECISICRR